MNDWPPMPTEWQADPTLLEKYREAVIAAATDIERQRRLAPAGSLEGDPSEQRLQDALVEMIKGSVERARDGAKFVETAAAAVGTIYAAILGLVFAAGSRPLPPRGIYAAIFLAAAIVGATFYLAYVQRIKPLGRPRYVGVGPEDMWRRTEWLSRWVAATVHNRAWALHGAVVSLALGVAFLPVAFLPDRTGGIATEVAALVAFLAGVGIAALIAWQGLRGTKRRGQG